MAMAASSLKKAEKTGLQSVIAAPFSVAASAPAVPVLTGTHFHSLDDKGRVIIPSKLRPALTEEFWLVIDENNNIAIYNYQTWLDILEHFELLVAENPGEKVIVDAVERTTGSAERVNVEGNWRVPISDVLRLFAGIDKEVVTVGVLNHAVIWDRKKWEAAQADRLQDDEVRRVQGEMLRAAASGIRKRAHEQAKKLQATQEEQERLEQIRAAAGADAGAQTGQASASASDGGRSAHLLALSKLGR